MRSANPSKVRRFLPALIGGLTATLMMLVFVVPANAVIVWDPNDDRRQIGDTTAKPYASVVEIVLGTADTGPNKGKSLGACTGWLYANNMVATAGHCLYNPADVTGGYVHISGMKVWPGLNGDHSDGTPNAPYGSCTVAAAHLSSTYVNTYASYPEGDVRFDYGALKLNCSVGSQTGLLNNYGVQPTPGWTTRVVGYPDDKPMDTQWYSDKTVYTYDSYQVYYANDTVTRMSGSPVMEWTNSGWNVVAIHSRGWGTDYNTGPRITSTVSNDLYNWQYQ